MNKSINAINEIKCMGQYKCAEEILFLKCYQFQPKNSLIRYFIVFFLK